MESARLSSSSCKDTSPIRAGSYACDPTEAYVPEGWSPDTVTLGLGLPHMNLGWGDSTIQSQNHPFIDQPTVFTIEILTVVMVIP